jgi:hypothetical protein
VLVCRNNFDMQLAALKHVVAEAQQSRECPIDGETERIIAIGFLRNEPPTVPTAAVPVLTIFSRVGYQVEVNTLLVAGQTLGLVCAHLESPFQLWGLSG